MSRPSFNRSTDQMRAKTRKDKKAEYAYMRAIEKVGEQPGYFNPNMSAIRRGLKERAIRRVLGPHADYFELTDAGREIFANIKRIKAM
ncbi:hypothetical protein EN833_03235 [Mesorhizobium sp. M4B.F.Ca.ET.190.01.1.1]|uniref:hypothetical protein n=1 Tax=unclassified Mesorhizobium TaxID=325217 RepID=UPI00109202F5|nr:MULTISPECIES: hypothetical protein [unclassified Mesorhizobium]TGR15159.1 hypothetical protein EN843_03230 [Mesorhizobium sp. M4B.F.Ca.ET.200.01.1.1]TGS23033.1 hypothetical protein EN833_03235 [Mesorhizobium sp. M4B.F.Ca.ET.190.01.1.1]TGT33868.1 hypothetical protein EN815_03230 [Mesorhizobium sp. M4B.F.Ca.ET.172.01.1.1]